MLDWRNCHLPPPTPERVWFFSVDWGLAASGHQRGRGIFGCPVLHSCQQWLNPPAPKSPQHLACLVWAVPVEAQWSLLVGIHRSLAVLVERPFVIWWVSVSFFDIRYPEGFCLLGNQFIVFDKFVVFWIPVLCQMYVWQIHLPFWLAFSVFDSVLFWRSVFILLTLV